MIEKCLAVLMVLFVMFAAGSCTDEEATIAALGDEGYTDIRAGGYAWFACSKDDRFKTKYTARNAQGKQVSGAVCCGFLKGCTVRH